MKTFWTIQLGIGVAAIAGFAAFGVACGSSSTTVVTDTDTDIDTDITDDTDDTDVTDDTESTETDNNCTCACEGTMGGGTGCGDICNTSTSGATTPNFCEGMSPLTQCGMCLASVCPGVDTTAGTCSQ